MPHDAGIINMLNRFDNRTKTNKNKNINFVLIN